MTAPARTTANRRILVIDDNCAIHEDFRKILGAPDAADAALLADELEIFGTPYAMPFDIDTAAQGEEGLQMVERALAEGLPYAVAFVDMRMPPGWDGLQTTKRLWEVCPDLQIVICTAYSDCSWGEMQEQIQPGDRLVILKKPFDTIEVLQLANALSEKWRLLQESRWKVEDLERLVRQRTAVLEEKGRVVENMSEGVTVCSTCGEISFSNAACETMFGYGAGEMCGLHIAALYQGTVEEGQEFVKQLAKQVDAGGMWTGELNGRKKDGTPLVVRTRVSILEFDGRKSYITLFEDITAKKVMEAHLLRSQRIESVGRLASGIAHDLNNILTPVLMASYMVRQQLPPDELEMSLNIIETSARRGADLVKQLLMFGRGDGKARTVMHVDSVFSDVVKMIGGTFPKNITLDYRMPGDCWPVMGDATQLHQLLLNLCVNARDAMPRGGVLRLYVQNVKLDENFVSMAPQAKIGPWLKLQVTDTGAGIPAEIIDKIFDPFFTTKEAGKGTGIGLSTAMGIIESHQGFLNLRSQVRAGTTFEIYLPAVPEAKAVEEATVPAGTLSGRGELILVVEDEPGIRAVTEKTLAGNGYRVVTAGDGTEGIVAYCQHRDEIKVVVTDIMMPSMDGVTMSRILKKMDPSLKIVASSGIGSIGGREQKAAELNSLGVETFLAKPYSAEVILSALKKALVTC